MRNEKEKEARDNFCQLWSYFVCVLFLTLVSMRLEMMRVWSSYRLLLVSFMQFILLLWIRIILSNQHLVGWYPRQRFCPSEVRSITITQSWRIFLPLCWYWKQCLTQILDHYLLGSIQNAEMVRQIQLLQIKEEMPFLYWAVTNTRDF